MRRQRTSCCPTPGPVRDRQHRSGGAVGPVARALFARVTAAVECQRRRGGRLPRPKPVAIRARLPRHHGWRARPMPPRLTSGAVGDRRPSRGAARRRAFRVWLDERRAELVGLAPGYETPGTPASPTTRTGTELAMLTLTLDIGGTKIAAGLVDPSGALVYRAARPTPKERGAETGLGCNSADDRRGFAIRRGRHPRGRHRRPAPSICTREPSARSTSRPGATFR